MGDIGSFEHVYQLGQRTAELEGVTVILDSHINDFSGYCEACDRFFDVGADIVEGKVVRVWVLREIVPYEDRATVSDTPNGRY